MNHDGHIDAIQVTGFYCSGGDANNCLYSGFGGTISGFNSPILDSTFTPPILSVTLTWPRELTFGYTGIGPTNVIVDDQFFYFNFSTSSAFDTGTSVEIPNTNLNSEDFGFPEWPFFNWYLYESFDDIASAMPFATERTYLMWDFALPIVVLTKSVGNNGTVAGVQLQFSEWVDDSSYSPSQWSWVGYSPTGMATGIDNDNFLTLLFVPNGVSPSNVLTYVGFRPPTTPLTDLAGNGLWGSSFEIVDGVPPVIWSAFASGVSVAIQFSEPVFHSNATAIQLGDILLFSQSANTVIAMASSSTVHFVLTLELPPLPSDRVGCRPTTVVDGVGNWCTSLVGITFV
jgi:hypothetical protein